MAEEPISDKALIKLYLKAKGIRRLAFCNAIGFSRSFLDADGTITVDNMRKIISHTDYDDFNLEAFIEQRQDMVKEKGQLSRAMASHSFIVEAVRKLTEIKVAKGDVDQEDTKQLMAFLDQAIEKLSNLSEDYQKLFYEYQRLYKIIEKESKS
ncbi:MAG: hypothetical protein AAF149_07170 [Bacteroidota bacterium]